MSFSMCDLILMSLGNYLISESEDFDCLNDNTVVAKNNFGAGFLLAYSLNLIMFSFMIWFAFYKLPHSFGLITTTRDKMRLISKERG